MRVKAVEIINLKSYQHSVVEFSESINLLTGANNSGKSTIIKSLLNLQYRAFEKRDIRVTEEYSKTYTKLVDISEKDNKSFFSPEYQNEYEESNEFTICWGLTNGNQSEEIYYYNSKYKTERLGRNRIKITNEQGEQIQLKHFPRFSDKENKNNFIYPFLSKRKTEHYDSVFNQEQTFKVSEDLRNLGAKIQKIGNSTHPKHGEFIKLCEEILGFKIGVISTEQNNGVEPGIFVTDTELISIRSMGDGVANIVGFIIILLTENNKLFLIEELENDIHPKALKKLLNLIVEKSNNNQFVISTHSHIVLKYLGVAPKSKIFYTDWKAYEGNLDDNKKNPTSVITEVENKPETRIDILEKLGYDFHDFELYESYLILEESSAERIIKDVLIPNFVPELYNRIKTIAARGVDDLETRVSDFNRLFVFIHTNPIYYQKAWVIADGDVAGKTCITGLKKDFNKWPADHFINFTKNDFEEYYPERFEEKVKKALAIKDKQKRRDAKKELLNEVMSWVLNNRENAINEFSLSAKEVITILKSIHTKISKK